MPIGPSPDPVLDEAFGDAPVVVRLSVIVVAWRIEDGVMACMQRLAELLPSDVEVLVVGNAVDVGPAVEPLKAAGLSGRVLRLADNDGPSPARNAAAARAIAPVLAFLDDDARIEAGWVDALLAGVARDDVHAVRGRVVAESRPLLTRLARAYDLGPDRRVALLNTEGNMAVRASSFVAVDGFAAMFGHEGVELSFRLRAEFGDESIWYEPAAVIRHDYVTGIRAYLVKRFRHGRNMARLRPADIRLAANIRAPQTARDRLLSPVRWVGGAAEVAGALWSGFTRSSSR